MEVKYGKGKTEYGPGVEIKLNGDEIATAIDAYLTSHNIHVSGPRTISVNNRLIEDGRVYVDPSGFVISHGVKFSGDKVDKSNLFQQPERTESQKRIDLLRAEALGKVLRAKAQGHDVDLICDGEIIGRI